MAFLIAQSCVGGLLLSTSDFLILLSGCQDPISLVFVEPQRGADLSPVSPFTPKVNAFLHGGSFQHTPIAWTHHQGWPDNLSFLTPSCLQEAPRLAGRTLAFMFCGSPERYRWFQIKGSIFIARLTLCDTWGFRCLVDPFDKSLNFSQLHFLRLLKIERERYLSHRRIPRTV